ncbi:MAG: ferritin-like domain-containing protein [Gammaproteobacteria bacterium]
MNPTDNPNPETPSPHAPIDPPHSPEGHWTLDDIDYAAVDPRRLDGEPALLYLVAGASFVEIASDLYTRNLIEYFDGDDELQDWLRSRWEREEVQHGHALRRYVRAAWPDFDWDGAFAAFYADYSPLCKTELLGPTRALELAARCVVETGTASYYTVIERVSPEPVLTDLAGRIRSDEVRHYKYFYRYFRRYNERESVSRPQVFRTLASRLREVDDEDAYVAFKHVITAAHGIERFDRRDYRASRRLVMNLARPHYPYRMAAKMILKPLSLNRYVQRAAVPLLSAGARYLLAH